MLGKKQAKFALAVEQLCAWQISLVVAFNNTFENSAFKGLIVLFLLLKCKKPCGPNLNDVSLQNCRLLEKMDLEECVLITDTTLIHLAMGCPRLEKLSLSHCELITDEGIRHLGTSPCAAEHLTVLELDNCPLITDASLEHLISCHNLQRIELYDCQLITRVGIRRLRAEEVISSGHQDRQIYLHLTTLCGVILKTMSIKQNPSALMILGTE
ncbi:F-box/LRR-repeat protein 20 [Homalodisca vitripennis]|nr:F-box/LRR-repeat protein 20 [Homalodisca vitripennis]